MPASPTGTAQAPVVRPARVCVTITRSTRQGYNCSHDDVVVTLKSGLARSGSRGGTITIVLCFKGRSKPDEACIKAA